MNIKKLINEIKEDECIVLLHELGEAIIDKDDIVETINGEEHIFIQGTYQIVPIPCKNFHGAVVYKKTDLIEKMIE